MSFLLYPNDKAGLQVRFLGSSESSFTLQEVLSIGHIVSFLSPMYLQGYTFSPDDLFSSPFVIA